MPKLMQPEGAAFDSEPRAGATESPAATSAELAETPTAEVFDPPPPFVARPQKRNRRRLVVALSLAAVAAGGVMTYRHLDREKSTAPTYVTAVATKGAVEKTVTATGTLSPRVTVSVGSQVSGRILALYADFNDTVKKGQVIARLDPTAIRADLARATADLSSARARLAKAVAARNEALAKYRRDAGLAAKKIVAQADVETRLAAYRSAKAETVAALAGVAQSKAALAKVKDNLANTTIRSPINGVVITRSVDVGQTVAASLSAPTLFTIAEDLRKMEVHTSVAESDVGQLAAGMKVRFSVDAYPNDTFEGVVKQVRYEAQTVQNVVTYDAVISVDNGALKLRPGMTTNVTFVVAARGDVLRVPNAALRFRPPKSAAGKAKDDKARAARRARWSKARAARAKAGKATSPPKRSSARTRGAVYVLRDGKLTRVRLRLGLSDGSSVEVTKGELSAGDKVVTAFRAKSSKASAASSKRKRDQRQRRGRGRRIF